MSSTLILFEIIHKYNFSLYVRLKNKSVNSIISESHSVIERDKMKDKLKQHPKCLQDDIIYSEDPISRCS
jgi:hypothetical protein